MINMGLPYFLEPYCASYPGREKKSAFGKADQHGGTKTAMPVALQVKN